MYCLIFFLLEFIITALDGGHVFCHRRQENCSGIHLPQHIHLWPVRWSWCKFDNSCACLLERLKTCSLTFEPKKHTCVFWWQTAFNVIFLELSLPGTVLLLKTTLYNFLSHDASRFYWLRFTLRHWVTRYQTDINKTHGSVGWAMADLLKKPNFHQLLVYELTHR